VVCLGNFLTKPAYKMSSQFTTALECQPKLLELYLEGTTSIPKPSAICGFDEKLALTLKIQLPLVN